MIQVLLLAFATPARAGLPHFVDESARLQFEVLAYDLGGDGFYGAGWLDYDNDGDLDVVLADGYTRANGLFQNQGDGTFVDATVTAGVQGTGSSMVLAADLDSDGWTDLFFTGDGGIWNPDLQGQDTPVRVYFNNGDGTFSDHTDTAGVVMPGTGLPATAGDIDGDRDLDLYIGSPGSIFRNRSFPNRLFVNNGDRTFTDVSVGSEVNTEMGACAATFAPLDDDAKIDLLVSNCSEVPCCEPTPFEVFVNNGDHTFTDRRLESEIWDIGFWMGHTFADFDGNGHMDFFATNTQRSRHALYLNNGDFTWTDEAEAAGVADWEFGWGTVSPDVDNDGFPDIYYVGAFPDGFSDELLGPGLASPGHLFRNRGDGTFEPPVQPYDVSCRFATGLATADYDNNGFSDLLVVSAGTEREFTPACPDTPGTPVLLRNEGNANHWLTFVPRGTTSNAGAVGATVRVLAGGREQLRWVTAGESFLATDSPWPMFGLGAATEADVCVRWPEGQGEAFGVQAADRIVELVQGQGVASTRCEAGWDGTMVELSDTGLPPDTDTTDSGGHTDTDSDPITDTGVATDSGSPGHTDSPDDTDDTDGSASDTGTAPEPTDTADPQDTDPDSEPDTDREPADSDHPVDPPGPTEGCGCTTGRTPGVAWAPLAALVLVAGTRRRSGPGRPAARRGYLASFGESPVGLFETGDPRSSLLHIAGRPETGLPRSERSGQVPAGSGDFPRALLVSRITSPWEKSPPGIASTVGPGSPLPRLGASRGEGEPSRSRLLCGIRDSGD